jgi:hypothetical protein
MAGFPRTAVGAFNGALKRHRETNQIPLGLTR